MAYFSKLTDEQQNALSEQLLFLVSKEHEAQYQSNLAKAKSKRQQLLCAGRYEGAWYRLFNSWLLDTTSTLHVKDCLKANIVIGDAQGVSFQPISLK